MRVLFLLGLLCAGKLAGELDPAPSIWKQNRFSVSFWVDPPGKC